MISTRDFRFGGLIRISGRRRGRLRPVPRPLPPERDLEDLVEEVDLDDLPELPLLVERPEELRLAVPELEDFFLFLLP